MADLKPLGSEKLNGDDKLKRILELTYYQNNNSNKKKPSTELVKESKAGGVYGIVKEKDGYYVKRGLNEQSLDYIGGLFMKNKNKFSSYAEALKRLELLKGQEELQEATKYVLKKKMEEEVPALPPAPMDAPAADMPADMPTPDAGAEAPAAEPEAEPTGEPKPSDYMAEVQKYAGKLGQELRDQQLKMESDDIKYVLNMVISAVNLDKLDLEDLEEIGKKFEREEEEGEAPASEPEAAEEPAAEPAAEPAPEQPEGELSEISPMDKLDEFINSEMDFSEEPQMNNEDVVELDLSEIESQINQSVKEILGKHFK